jgi:hypothetical protein
VLLRDKRDFAAEEPLVRSASRSPGPPEGAVLKYFHRIRMGRLAGPVAPITERTAYLSGRAHRAIVAMARPALPGPMASPDAPDVSCSTSGARRKPGRATVLPTATEESWSVIPTQGSGLIFPPLKCRPGASNSSTQIADSASSSLMKAGPMFCACPRG